MAKAYIRVDFWNRLFQHRAVMLTQLKSLFAKTRLKPQGEAGIREIGHREYVGGLWEQIGRLQLDFLVDRGLLPDHHLLDIACGSLRLGVHAIPFLEPGHYLGIEKEQGLIDAGINEELGRELFVEKRPVLIADAYFDFSRFNEKPDFVIAQSLFTHLTSDVIALCFTNLHPIMKSTSRFYATYFLSDGKNENPEISHDHDYFSYSLPEIIAFGEDAGFSAKYIGEWGHPRNQMMVEYTIMK